MLMLIPLIIIVIFITVYLLVIHCRKGNANEDEKMETEDIR